MYRIGDKRGFLLAEETLKIIIAVIGIVILGYFLTSLYFNYTDSRELEQAKASLDNLIAQINAKNANVNIYNPEAWYLLSWPTAEGLKPQACTNLGWANCICMCKKKFYQSESDENLKNACDNSGYCTKAEKPVVVEEKIKIENPPVVLSLDINIENIKISRAGARG